MSDWRVMKRISIVTLFWFCLSVAFVTVDFAQTSDIAPDFTLKDMTGKIVSLHDFLGKPVLLVFSTTWCPNCRMELPEIKKIYDRYGGKGLVVLAIDIMESQEKVSKFFSKRNVPYQVLLDADGKISEKYGVIGVPTRVLIDTNGRIICWACRTFDEKLKQLFG